MGRFLYPVYGAVMLLSLLAGLFLGGIYFYFTRDLPRISSLEDYRPPIITTVYSDDNRKIAEFSKETGKGKLGYPIWGYWPPQAKTWAEKELAKVHNGEWTPKEFITAFQKEYADTAKDPEAWDAFRARYLDLASEQEYQAAVKAR